MKVLALILVCLAAYATARPSSDDTNESAPSSYYSYFGSIKDAVVNKVSAAAASAKPLVDSLAATIGPQLSSLASATTQYYNDNWASTVNQALETGKQLYNDNLQPHVSVLAQSAQQYLTSFVTYLAPYIESGAQGALEFMTSVQAIMQQQIDNAGPMSLDLLTKLVNSTINFAVSNGILTEEGGNSLLATFASPEPATLDVEALQVSANEAAVTSFKGSVQVLLALKENQTSPYALLGGLEAALMRLLAAQSIVKAQAVASTMSAVGLAKVQEAYDASLNYLGNLKNQIANSEIAQQAPGAVNNAVSYVAGLSSQLAQSEAMQKMVQQAQQLLAQTPELFNSSVNYAYDLKDQVAQTELVQQLAKNAPEVYESYKQSVNQMINQIKDSAVAQQVAQEAPKYAEAFVTTMSNIVNQMAQTQIVQLTLQKAPEYYTASLALLTNLKSQVVEKTPEVYNNLRGALSEKLAAGGQATQAGLAKALQGLVGLSANKYLLNPEDAARLAASLGIQNQAAPLKKEEVAQLVIQGNPQVAANLKASIVSALPASPEETTLSNLSAVNSALVAALAKNGFIDGAAALGLNAIIGA